MSDSQPDESQRIRAEKERELQRRLDQADTDEGGASEPEDSTEPIQIRDADHFDTVVESHRLVLVDCYADWCGPCQMLEPTIEALAAESPATVAKVDVDRLPHIAQQLGVRGVPTIVFYVDGEAADRLVGLQDRSKLEAVIEQYD